MSAAEKEKSNSAVARWWRTKSWILRGGIQGQKGMDGYSYALNKTTKNSVLLACMDRDVSKATGFWGSSN